MTAGRVARADCTPAEMALIRWMAAGLTQAQAATALGISPNTVKSRLAKLFVHTGTLNVAHLVHVAHVRGWLPDGVELIASWHHSPWCPAASARATAPTGPCTVCGEERPIWTHRLTDVTEGSES